MTPAAVRKPEGYDPVIFLVSQEHFLLKEREGQIRDRLVPRESRDLNFQILYGWEAEVTRVVEFLQTMPFLAEKRLLVIREVQTFEEVNHLDAYMKDPNPASCLLMTSSELKKKDPLYRKLSRLARVSEVRKPGEDKLADWVVERFAAAGKAIEKDLADALVQTAAGDMAILATEIQKIVSGSGEADTISKDDLSVSVPGGVEVVFNFLDALGEGDHPKAMAAQKKLLDHGNKPEYLVHMMAWHFRQLIRGRDHMDSGLNPRQAAEKMGKKYPEAREKFARQIRRATSEGLIQALEILSGYDLELKRGGIPERMVLDRLVLDLLRGGSRVDLPGKP